MNENVSCRFDDSMIGDAQFCQAGYTLDEYE